MNINRYWPAVNTNNNVILIAYILTNIKFLNFGFSFIDSTYYLGIAVIHINNYAPS